MKEDTKRAKLAALLGIPVEEIRPTASAETARREADATILFLENPKGFRQATCKQCSRQFATNYGSVAMCSDQCRIQWLRNIGIEWDRTKKQEERWGRVVPLTVPPDALVLANEVLQEAK